MALYQGLHRQPDDAPRPRAWQAKPKPGFSGAGWKAPVTAPRREWRALRHEAHGELSDAPMLDRLLGQGASHTLGRAVGTAIARARAPRGEAAPALEAPRREVPVHRQRFQAVGAGEAPLPRGRKGVIRGALLLFGVAAAVLALKPWQRLGALHVDVAALFSAPDPEAQAKAEALKHQQDAADATRLAALPLEPGTGKALGLWQDARGAWFTVDGEGLLAPGDAPGAKASLGLVPLRGLAAHSEPHGQGRRLRLDLPDGLLKELLPLRPGVASEAQALLLSEAGEPVVLTHDGARCLLSRDRWEAQQDRLALVLADLAARKRRAGLIDLRYEDSAVVRPIGR
jgi:hypothetical protein